MQRKRASSTGPRNPSAKKSPSFGQQWWGFRVQGLIRDSGSGFRD